MASQTVQGSGTVLSKGLAATSNFYPLTPWVSTAATAKARAATEMAGDSGSCQIAPAYQTADKVEEPNTPVQIGSNWVQANGISYQSAFSTIATSTDQALFVRFGVLVKQDADGGIQGCQASIRVDIRE